MENNLLERADGELGNKEGKHGPELVLPSCTEDSASKVLVGNAADKEGQE